MAIFKAKHESHYAQIPNSTLRDDRLSFEARGVLAMILSLPDDWSINVAWICKQSPSAGRDKVTRILKELQDFGYMVKRVKQNEDGKLAGVDWDVHCYPVQLENRTTGNPLPGKSDTTKKELNKEREKQSKPVRSRTTKPEAFKQFFDQYPGHRKGGSDSAAWKKWKSEKLTEQDAEMALSWVIRASAVPGWSESRFVMGIVNFIGQRMWLTDVEKIANEISPAVSTTGNQPAADIHAQRQAKLDEWERQMHAAGHGQCQNAVGSNGGDLWWQVDSGQRGDATDRPAITLDDSDWKAD